MSLAKKLREELSLGGSSKTEDGDSFRMLQVAKKPNVGSYYCRQLKSEQNKTKPMSLS